MQQEVIQHAASPSPLSNVSMFHSSFLSSSSSSLSSAPPSGPSSSTTSSSSNSGSNTPLLFNEPMEMTDDVLSIKNNKDPDAKNTRLSITFKVSKGWRGTKSRDFPGRYFTLEECSIVQGWAKEYRSGAMLSKFFLSLKSFSKIIF